MNSFIGLQINFCVEKFQLQTDSAAKLIEFKKATSWDQRSLIEKGGWAAPPGSEKMNSAVANAEQTPGIIAENLVVSSAWVDEGPTLNRFRPRAYGRSARVRKRTAHVTLVLQTMGEEG